MVIEQFGKDLRSCLNYRWSVVFIESFDFSTVSDELHNAIEKEDLHKIFPVIAEWNAGYGKTKFRSNNSDAIGGELVDVLQQFIDETKVSMLVLKDIHDLLLNNASARSLLQTFVFKNDKLSKDKRSIIVIMDAVYQLPIELEKLFYRLTYPYPDKDDIRRELFSEKYKLTLRLRKDEVKIQECVNSLVGMQMYEIRSLLKKTMDEENSINTGNTIAFANYKKQIVKNSGVLEVIDSDISKDDDIKNNIGGLEELINYLRRKKKIIDASIERSEYNLPAPKGVLLVGSPGCGKTITAKAIASLFRVPLLRLDMSRLMGAYVGESEHNLAKAIAVAEAAQPCVLWIDEIEKAFAGSGGKTGENSDITVRRMVGSFLTWLQERKSEVYIAATANDLSSLPPELRRKGRLDDVFYVTYPSKYERRKIFEISIMKHNIKEKISQKDLEILAGDKPVSFSGAEIDSIVQTACEYFFIEKLNGSDPSIIEIIKKIIEDDKYKLNSVEIKKRTEEVDNFKKEGFLSATKYNEL